MIYAENIVAEAKDIAPKLKVSLESALPSHHVAVKSSNHSIVVSIWGYMPANNIPENSPSFMKFIMHLSNGSGRHVDVEKVSFEKLIMNYELGDAGVKYRKISGKSILGASEKLLKWVEKNSESIKSVEK